MKDNIKIRWVEALRGGDFQQAQGVLANGDGGYCCLGVLTSLYADEQGLDANDRHKLFHVVNSQTLPTVVCEWAGLMTKRDTPMRDPHIDGYGLSLYNDGDSGNPSIRLQGESFEFIAGIIEENF